MTDKVRRVRGLPDELTRDGVSPLADVEKLVIEGRYGRADLALRRLEALIPSLAQTADTETLLLALYGRALLLRQLGGGMQDAIAACDVLERAAHERQTELWASTACATRARFRVDSGDIGGATADLARADAEMATGDLTSDTGYRLLDGLAVVYAGLRLHDRADEVRTRIEHSIERRRVLDRAQHWSTWAGELAARAMEPLAGGAQDPQQELMGRAIELAAKLDDLPEDDVPSTLRRGARGVRALSAAYRGRPSEALRLLGPDAFGTVGDLPLVERQIVSLAAMRAHALVGSLATARSLDDAATTPPATLPNLILEVCRTRERLWLETYAGGDVIPVLHRMTELLVRLGWRGMDLVADTARQALEHQALRAESRTDALTGVGNRRALDEELRQLLRFGPLPLALILVDVDKFKEVNDRFTHVVGDEVLRRVAASLSLQLRTDDQLLRYGGDEFVVLLPGTGDEEANAVADRMREAVAVRPWNELADGLGVTITTGVAAVWSLSGRRPDADAEKLFRRADERLLDAKRDRPEEEQGRSRSYLSIEASRPQTSAGSPGVIEPAAIDSGPAAGDLFDADRAKAQRASIGVDVTPAAKSAEPGFDKTATLERGIALDAVTDPALENPADGTPANVITFGGTNRPPRTAPLDENGPGAGTGKGIAAKFEAATARPDRWTAFDPGPDDDEDDLLAEDPLPRHGGRRDPAGDLPQLGDPQRLGSRAAPRRSRREARESNSPAGSGLDARHDTSPSRDGAVEAAAVAREVAEAEAAEARHQAARESADRDRIAREQAARDKAAREVAAREQAEREARDKAAREQSAREQAARQAREQVARETAAREQAERAQREQAERAQREQAERERREQAERERREQAERDRVAREQAVRDRERREQAERERVAREKAAQEARDREARERAQREAREQAERERAAQAERERAAREQAAREEAARQAREAAQRAARERERQQAQAQAEADRLRQEAQERAQQEAMAAERARREAAERAANQIRQEAYARAAEQARLAAAGPYPEYGSSTGSGSGPPPTGQFQLPSGLTPESGLPAAYDLPAAYQPSYEPSGDLPGYGSSGYSSRSYELEPYNSKPYEPKEYEPRQYAPGEYDSLQDDDARPYGPSAYGSSGSGGADNFGSSGYKSASYDPGYSPGGDGSWNSGWNTSAPSDSAWNTSNPDNASIDPGPSDDRWASAPRYDSNGYDSLSLEPPVTPLQRNDAPLYDSSQPPGQYPNPIDVRADSPPDPADDSESGATIALPARREPALGPPTSRQAIIDLSARKRRSPSS
jgi:diguanylate cyclase (GGDEF)-like protein